MVDPFAKLVLAIVAVAAAASIALPARASAPGAQDQRLFDEVRLFTKGNQDAIRSIRYSYTMTLGDSMWRSRVRKSGARYYQASIVERGDGNPSLPAEIAWDGEREYTRTRYQLLRIAGKEGMKSTVNRPDIPEHVLFIYLWTAFGFSSDEVAAGANYRLISATLDAEADEIHLSFAGPGDGWTLASVHDRSRNCMPVRIEFRDPGGIVMYRMERVEYARFETPGGTVFFPTEIDGTIGYPEGTIPPRRTNNYRSPTSR